MDHEEVLNRILSLQCPSDDTDGIVTIDISLHCVSITIVARKIGMWDSQAELQKYEILNFKSH